MKSKSYDINTDSKTKQFLTNDFVSKTPIASQSTHPSEFLKCIDLGEGDDSFGNSVDHDKVLDVILRGKPS